MATNEIQNGCEASIEAVLASNHKRRCDNATRCGCIARSARPGWKLSSRSTKVSRTRSTCSTIACPRPPSRSARSPSFSTSISASSQAGEALIRNLLYAAKVEELEGDISVVMDSEKEREPAARKLRAKICVDSWAGRREFPCEIIGETKTKYVCRMLGDGVLPRRHVRLDDIVKVPKHAVRIETPDHVRGIPRQLKEKTVERTVESERPRRRGESLVAQLDSAVNQAEQLRGPTSSAGV